MYVQETDQSGNVIANWAKVPALAGENIIYNSIQNSQRNIFDVISGANDEDIIVLVKDAATLADATGNFVRVIGLVE